MGKDVIMDRYARLYEFPKQLAALGHDVLVECIGYQGQGSGQWSHEAPPGKLLMRSQGIRKPWLLGLLALPTRLLKKVREFRPDIIVGASDIPCIAIAAWLSRKVGVPLVADLYDNFEAFGQARVPGMITALRRSARSARLITTTSEALARYVRESYGVKGDVVAMPSTIDRDVFRPGDRTEARRSLGLPRDARLIGTAGGLHKAKGIGELYAAWDILQADPAVHLVLAGPIDGSIPMPTGDRVHYLGQLRHEDVALLFIALDVATICVLDTPFGRYCFPQKAYEILATGTPVVASDVGAMSDVLSKHPSLLYRPGDPSSLAACVRAQLDTPICTDVEIQDWKTVISAIEPRFLAMTTMSTDV